MTTTTLQSSPTPSTMSTSSNDLTREDFRIWIQTWHTVTQQLDFIISSLKRRLLHGAHPCAKATIELLRSMLGNCKFSTTEHMLKCVRGMGRELIEAAPTELSIGNIVRRVLFIIREEYSQRLRAEELASTKDEGEFVKQPKKSGRTASEGSDDLNTPRDRKKSGRTATETSEDLQRFVPQLSKRQTSEADYLDSMLNPSLGCVIGHYGESYESAISYNRMFADMRQGIMQAINELNEEMDNVNQPIMEVALEQIHNDECIMVVGESYTVEKFLKAAARKRQFQLIVVGLGTSMIGQKMASALGAIGNIAVSLIPDSAIYSLMARVNKVIFSPHAVTADGGAICLSGHLMAALAAKEYSIPVVGVAGMYKLTPLFSHNQLHVLNHVAPPIDVIPFDAPVVFDNVEAYSTSFDFIEPDLVDLYVTNNGSHQPSYIYRLLSEFFHQQDYTI